MAWTDNFIAFDFTAGQLRPIMSTDILNGVKVLAVAHHGNHASPSRNRLGLPIRQFMGRTHINPRHKKDLASLTSSPSAGAPRRTSWSDSKADQILVPHSRAPPSG